MRLDGYVHFGNDYANAFWDGQQMVFGDGDGSTFADLTGSLDVIAHELTHGVTEYAAGLEYRGQSGALNESMSDVMGSLVKQWSLGQKANLADWLIGTDVFTPRIDADALRSLKAPGTAYDNAEFGKDPQPDHMRNFVKLPDTDEGDFGGVHVNSGIPNKAFYLVATNIGGFAWEAAGHIWYEALKMSSAQTQFQEFADFTHVQAAQLYGTGGNEQQAVSAAWADVGIKVTEATARAGTTRARKTTRVGNGADRPADGLATLESQIAALSVQVQAMAKTIDALSGHR